MQPVYVFLRLYQNQVAFDPQVAGKTTLGEATRTQQNWIQDSSIEYLFS